MKEEKNNQLSKRSSDQTENRRIRQPDSILSLFQYHIAKITIIDR